MNPNTKPDEHYVDGKDTWSIYHITSDETRLNPGAYKETIRFVKNGELVGQTVWHKDSSGNSTTKPCTVGVQHVPTTALRLNK